MEKLVQTPMAKQAGDLKPPKNPQNPADTSSIGNMSRSSYVSGRNNFEEFFTPEQCASLENFTAETLGLMDHNCALVNLPQGVGFLSGEDSEGKEGESAEEFGGSTDMNSQLFEQEELAPIQPWGCLTSSGGDGDDYEWNSLPGLYSRLNHHGGAIVHDDFGDFSEVLAADKDLSKISATIGMPEGYEMGLPLDDTNGGQLASLSAWTLPQSGFTGEVEYTGDEYLSGGIGDILGSPPMSNGAFSSAAHASTQNFIPNVRPQKRKLDPPTHLDNQSEFNYVDGQAFKRCQTHISAEDSLAPNTQRYKFKNQQAQPAHGRQQMMDTHEAQPQGTLKGNKIFKFAPSMKGQSVASNMGTQSSSQVLTEETAVRKARTPAPQARKGGRSVPPDDTDPRWNIWVVGNMEVNHKSDGITKKHLRAALTRDDKQPCPGRSKWTFTMLTEEVIARRKQQMESGKVVGRPNGWLEHLAWWSYF